MVKPYKKGFEKNRIVTFSFYFLFKIFLKDLFRTLSFYSLKSFKRTSLFHTLLYSSCTERTILVPYLVKVKQIIFHHSYFSFIKIDRCETLISFLHVTSSLYHLVFVF